MVKNLPANAGDMSSIPGPGRAQTKPKTTTSEPTCCNYWNPCTLEPVLHEKEGSTMRSLHTTTSSPQLEKDSGAVEIQHSKKFN